MIGCFIGAIHFDRAGCNILRTQTDWVVGDPTGDIGDALVESIKESVQPRDAVEEMLVLQMLWTHARLAKLSAIANEQVQRANVRLVHDACDRAANTFRRQMAALSEYRRPPRGDAFIAIKQANLAAQQVVQNVELTNSSTANTSNEQGWAAELPPLGTGTGVPARDGAEQPAVAVEQRPKDDGGQGTVEAERDEAR